MLLWSAADADQGEKFLPHFALPSHLVRRSLQTSSDYCNRFQFLCDALHTFTLRRLFSPRPQAKDEEPREP
ncbi:hypothetical protein MC77_009670 [Citrobacter koseri]|nr:hypothetical protein MC77_009670 [Citrobacter koseri]